MQAKSSYGMNGLGHISKNKFTQVKVKQLDSNCLTNINPLGSLCETCTNGNQARFPFAKSKK